MLQFFNFNANIYFLSNYDILTASFQEKFQLCYFCPEPFLKIDKISKNQNSRVNFQGAPIGAQGYSHELCESQFRFKNCGWSFRFYSTAQAHFNFILSMISTDHEIISYLQGDKTSPNITTYLTQTSFIIQYKKVTKNSAPFIHPYQGYFLLYCEKERTFEIGSFTYWLAPFSLSV
ncbi:hypothetical protein Fcan01_10110 [Folsomia candida]|uniref:Uncharacterized protein n=1 Tax=Folsomia candida TaxID=158441 RepID=A0A226EDY8_FOLCA|nr:hypothetical protein Fcan01_10110 [Folsomia candida]